MKNNPNEFYRVILTTVYYGDELEDWVSFDNYDNAIEFCDNHQVGQKFYNHTIVDIRLEFIRQIL